MIKLNIDGLIYFFAREAHDLMVNHPNPSDFLLRQHALAVIDPVKCEVVKTRYTLEDVFTEALKEK